MLRSLFEMSVEDEHLDGRGPVFGNGILFHTGLDPSEINDAVEVLASRGLTSIQSVPPGVLMLPWRFSTVMPTPEGRRLYDARKREENVDARKVFVIHGRDLRARDAMFAFLRALDLKPIEWDKAVEMTGAASPYTGQVLEAAFREAQAVVALFTGDDEAHLRPELLGSGEAPEPLTPQPRPNVLLEAGMAMGSHPERTLFVHVGRLRPISDLLGRHVVLVEKGRPWRQEIADRLRTTRCGVDTDHHRDWEKEGAELEEAGARATASIRQAASAPVSPAQTGEEQALLFRAAMQERAKQQGNAAFTINLGDERSGTPWAGLSEERLTAELKKMAQEDFVEIVEEAGAIFRVKRPPQRISAWASSRPPRGW